MSIAVVTLFELIPGFDRYGVSRDGEVYDFERRRFVSVCNHVNGYLCVNLYEEQTNKQRQFLLHRLLAIVYIPNPENLPCVDHKDRDRTNNSLSNLRWCTSQENCRNMTVRNTISKSSQYKGVSWDKNSNKWKAQIRIDGKKQYLGLFTDEKEAASAYNLTAREYFEDFANLNIL